MARPPAPVVAPLTGDIDQRLAQIAQAISARSVPEPTYSAVGLIAPDGSTWRLTVDATGALHTARVSRP